MLVGTASTSSLHTRSVVSYSSGSCEVAFFLLARDDHWGVRKVYERLKWIARKATS